MMNIFEAFTTVLPTGTAPRTPISPEAYRVHTTDAEPIHRFPVGESDAPPTISRLRLRPTVPPDLPAVPPPPCDQVYSTVARPIVGQPLNGGNVSGVRFSDAARMNPRLFVPNATERADGKIRSLRCASDAPVKVLEGCNPGEAEFVRDSNRHRRRNPCPRQDLVVGEYSPR